MIKVYCDICTEEVQQGNQYIGCLDFTNKAIELCDECFKKFKSGKEAIFSEYASKYSQLNNDYMNDLIDEITTDEEPAPVFD